MATYRGTNRTGQSAPVMDRAVDLATLDEKGKAPKERLKSAAALHSLYTTSLQADNASALNRAILQQDADGAPPQSDSALAASGMSWNYNLNFLGGDTKLQAALTAYSDLIDSTNELIVPEFHPDQINAEDESDAADVIAEEFSKLIRDDSNFPVVWERLGLEFTKFGVGFAYFPDEETWQWDAAGWNEFVMPRRTKVGEEKIPALFWEHDYRVHELYTKIRDEAHTNFDVDEVRKAIVTAAHCPVNNDKPWQTFWADIEMQLKNNDLGFSYGAVEEVHALHALVREMDGSVSFYIGLVNGSNAEHLYKHVGRYDKMTEAVVTFTLGVGNGTYHSIRGLLWKLYPFTQTSNRLQNKLLTQTDLSMSLMLQATDAESLDDMAITLTGAVAYLPPEDKAKVVTRTLPNVGSEGLPIIDYLSRSLDNATGQFQSVRGGVGVGGDNRHNVSKFQYAAEQEHAGSLTNNSVNRFCRSGDTLFDVQFKRVQKLNPKDARFPEVGGFYQRCEERGYPPEVIKKAIRRVRMVRPIGNGSPSMRAVALDRLQALAGSFDSTGRNLLTRDIVALSSNRMAADRYAPRQKRLAPEATVAVLENTILRLGDVPVLPDQAHGIHASIHVPEFQKQIEQLVAYREQDPSADFTPMKPVLQYALNLHNHAAQHVEQMGSDPLMLADAKAYKAALEQGANLAAAYARMIQQQERHQVGQQQQQGQDGGPSPEQLDKQEQYNRINASTQQLQFTAQRNEQQLRQAEESHQLDLQLDSTKVADAAQKMRLRDIETAATLKNNAAKAAATA